MATKKKVMTVGFPLYDDVTLMDFVGATEIFAFAEGFKPVWLADSIRPIKSSEGTMVYPNYSFKGKHPKIDILFVPGGGANGVINNGMFNKDFQDFIKKTSKTATWTGSVCVGAFILAAAGLLKNCKATTYWSQIPNLELLKDKFKLSFPKEKYVRGVIDTARKRFTGGGISSSVDLALMLVEKIAHKRIAEQAQLYTQYAPHPPVHAGDPSQAPKSLVKEMLKQGAAYDKLYYNAVQKLLAEK